MESRSWVAAHVKSRTEFSVSSILRDRGYETVTSAFRTKAVKVSRPKD
jgi:hypothetical protein